MAFIDDVRRLAEVFDTRRAHLSGEEATKHSLVLPFIELLGYHPSEPTDVKPEYTADFGGKKGEKVDYALLLNGEPVVLIEAKSYNSNLRVEQESQLFRYFATTPARFGILTDGIWYRFYADLVQSGMMDREPFFQFNMLDFSDGEAEQLKQFHKDNYDPGEIVQAAHNRKHVQSIKRALEKELRDPSEGFVGLILTQLAYPSPHTESRIQQFVPLVQQAIAELTENIVSARPKPVLNQGNGLANDASTQMAVAEGHIVIPEDSLAVIMTHKGIQAWGRYTHDRSVVVLAGSQIVKHERPSMARPLAERRRVLLSRGTLVDQGFMYILKEDVMFTSPSAAAVFVAGGSRNGWMDWQDEQGRNLDVLVRPRPAPYTGPH